VLTTLDVLMSDEIQGECHLLVTYLLKSCHWCERAVVFIAGAMLYGNPIGIRVRD
jgi:hypothetical protein